MPEAPPHRVLPNPLQGVAGCATVVTGPSVSLGRTVPVIGVRHAVPSLRGPPRRPAARARLGRRAHHPDPPAAGRRGRRTAGRARRRTDPQGRWQRALCDLARASARRPRRAPGASCGTAPPARARRARGGGPAVRAVPAAPRRGSLLSRVGSAEWNLLTDEVELVRRAVPDPRPGPRGGPAHPRRAALRGPRRGPAEADRDGHGLPHRRPSRSTASSASCGPTAACGPCT